MNWFKVDDSFLPHIHRRGGARELHDDFKIKIFGKEIPLWPFNLIPRRWTSAPQAYPPKMILGNQDYWNTALPDEYDSYKKPIGEAPLFGWPLFGAKPIPHPDGAWQFSLSYPKIFGRAIPIPYFAITKGGYTFYVGMRWSEAGKERYYNFAFPSFKKVRKSESEV